ncbi:MAG TPA: VOC family protein [Nitrososphaeraceae archaeon]|jgi:lactoylglutathione lyase|nr:VOC family protein [Nitrososphaeraceae archaeon]
MIDTIGGTVVIVSDQQKAIEFYTQKLGFELKSDILFGGSSGGDGIRWVEVAPKASQSTISLMVPNPMMMSDGVEIEAAKKSIGTETGIWFYSNNIQSTHEELKSKGVNITAPEKQEWGGIMSKLKDQDGNSYSIISSLPQPSTKQD